MTSRQHSVCIMFTAIAISIAGCNDDYNGHQQTTKDCPNPEYVCIRVQNSTGLAFESFSVKFEGQHHSFGPIADGSVSNYRRVGKAFRYAFTEALSGERRFILQPIDFVSEQHLLPGAYTFNYSVDVLDEPKMKGDWRLDGYLSARLVVDRQGE